MGRRDGSGERRVLEAGDRRRRANADRETRGLRQHIARTSRLIPGRDRSLRARRVRRGRDSDTRDGANVAESGVEWTRGEVGGWVDDSLALARPWGFDLGEIKVPVLLRYGLVDVFVPPGHGRWLAAQIPGCEVVIEDEAGHSRQTRREPLPRASTGCATASTCRGSQRDRAPAFEMTLSWIDRRAYISGRCGLGDRRGGVDARGAGEPRLHRAHPPTR